MTPEAVVEEELVPPNLSTTILREEQFKNGFVQGPLSAEALGALGERPGRQVKST